MNKLQKKDVIQISKHDPYYFQTLLTKAHATGKLKIEELQEIQAQCLILLAEQTQAFTKGRSSSVKTEVAESIFTSISYTIGIYLKHQEDTGTALHIIKSKPLCDIFEQGKNLIQELLADTKLLYETIKNDPIITENLAYNDTVAGIAVFFDTYDADFAAHETPGSIDYPVEVPTELCGIEYISLYLKNLFIENSFCKRFCDIDSLLRGYSDDFKELLINIFDLVLMNAIGCTMVNKNNSLHLDELDKQFLRQRFSHLADGQLLDIMLSTADNLCGKLQITNKTEIAYIRTGIPRLLMRLKNALDVDQLDKIFVSCKQPVAQNTVFSDNPKMDDEKFRRITQEIRGCSSVHQKIDVIHQEVNSFADLVDILEASCIWDEEFFAVFASLDQISLSMLTQIVQEVADDLHLSENQKIWYKKFQQFIDSN